MENVREVTRQEFLKSIPRYVRSLIQGRFDFSDDEAETRENILSDSKTPKVVRLATKHCLAWDGGNCQLCYLACPLRDKAITVDDQKPIINILFCDGCGQCVTACRTVNDQPALRMIAKEV